MSNDAGGGQKKQNRVAERLQKFIAGAGVTSRRKAEELITSGRVSVNGKLVKKLGATVDPTKDQVEVDSQLIKPITAYRYIALNKPVGIICTRAQYKNEKTVYGLVPNSRDLVIAGRLDKDSDGLVVLTNDGELTNELTHPRYQHAKEYEIHTIKPLDDAATMTLQRGVKLEEGYARFEKITTVEPGLYRVTLYQGWKRQIRRMIGRVHGDVKRLTRIRMNKLALGDLPVGQWKEVRRKDIL